MSVVKNSKRTILAQGYGTLLGEITHLLEKARHAAVLSDVHRPSDFRDSVLEIRPARSCRPISSELGLPNKVLATEYKLALPKEEQLRKEIERTRKLLERRVRG